MHGQLRPAPSRRRWRAFAVGRSGRARGHVGDRGRDRRAERDGDAGRGRRPLRDLATAPAARADRPRARTTRCACCSAPRSHRGCARWRVIRTGSQLAEIDLELRGEGELVGTRQHGLAQFRVAELPRDAELLERARRYAEEVIAEDPELTGARERAARRRAAWRVRRRGARADPGVRRARRRGTVRRSHARRAARARHPPDLRSCARGAVLDPGIGRGATACSTCSRGRARWRSRRSRGALRRRPSSTPPPAAVAAIRGNLSTLGVEAEVRRQDAPRVPQRRTSRRSSIRSGVPRSPISPRERPRARAVDGAGTGSRPGCSGSRRERPAGAARARTPAARRAPLRRHLDPNPWLPITESRSVPARSTPSRTAIST